MNTKILRFTVTRNINIIDEILTYITAHGRTKVLERINVHIQYSFFGGWYQCEFKCQSNRDALHIKQLIKEYQFMKETGQI